MAYPHQGQQGYGYPQQNYQQTPLQQGYPQQQPQSAPQPVPCLDSNGVTGPQRLLQDQRIFSFNKSYSVVMQPDGYLVVYSPQNQCTWSSSSGQQLPNAVPPYSLLMQQNGNLVIYGGNGVQRWTSNSTRLPGAYRLLMGDDGGLHCLDSSNQPVWNSSAPAPALAQSYSQPPQQSYNNAPQQQSYNAPAPQQPQAAQYNGPQGNRMDSSGQSGPAILQQDGSLVCNQWRLSMQGDGNLVLYDGGNAPWASRTTRKNDILSQFTAQQSPPYRLALGNDGNLCLFESGNRSLWSTQTNGRGSAPFLLVLQETGVVSLTDRTGWTTWQLVPGQGPQLLERPKLRNILCSAGTRGPTSITEPDSLTSASGQYDLVMQGDGHLVMYSKPDRTVCWSSKTSGKGKAPRQLLLKPDGNLVIIDASHATTWSSKSGNKPEQGPFAMLLQDNSSMEIFNAQNVSIWNSGNAIGGMPGAQPPPVGFSSGNGGTSLATLTAQPQQQPQQQGLGLILSSVQTFIAKPNANSIVGLVAAGSGGKLSMEKIAAGMKEAMRVGIDKAIKIVGVVDGFLLNMVIRILLPPKIADIAEVLRKFFSDQVRQFEVSMNRAAEKASSTAIDIFIQGIMAMTFEDVMSVFKGADTAITEWFSRVCRSLLYASFFPVVKAAMNEFSVTHLYKDLMSNYNKLPLVKKIDVNVEEWVVTKALDGLFHVLGEQEVLIKKNPVARITSLLQEVFEGFENATHP